MDDFKESASARHSRNETYELIDIMKAHSRHVGKVDTKSHCKPRSHLYLILSVKQTAFSREVTLNISTIFQDRTDVQEQLDIIKLTLWVCVSLCACVCILLFYFGIFLCLYNKLPLLNSSGYPGTLYVEQAGFELTEFHLPLSPRLNLIMYAIMPSSFLSY